MAKSSEFVALVEQVFKDNSVYIGTGNGERLLDLSLGDIVRMEKNYGDNPPKRVNQILSFVGKKIEAGVDLSKARAGDCSGIIVYCLRQCGAIKATADYRARDLQAKSVTVALKNLLPGDLVFNKKSEASHVGVYVGNGMVIESRGRSYGVVARTIKEGPWVIGGRLPWLTYEYTLTRALKYVKGAVMTGEDVSIVQTRLKELGYYSGEIDGRFGPATDAAVKAFQKDHNLAVDGSVGRLTATALGFNYGN